MSSFKLMSDIVQLNEVDDSVKSNILRRVQHALAYDHGINVSLLSLINFFMGKRTPSSDDERLHKGFYDRGYNFRGSYHDNAKFWNNILSPEEYSILISRKLKSAEDEEAEIYGGADTGEYSSLANIGSVEDEEFTKEVTPDDYREWLRIMQLEADDREVNLNNKRHFEDIAFFMLDNDPKVDMLGNNERTKRNIISVLWQQYNVNQAKKKAYDAKFKPRLPVEDEEQTSFAQSMGMPRGKWYDRKHHEDVLSDEEMLQHKDAAYQEGHGAAADHYQGVVRGMPKNPYASGSKRHQAWSKGFSDYEKGIWDKIHHEDEEYSMSYGTEEDEESAAASKAFDVPHEQNDLGYRPDGNPKGSAMPEPQARQFMLVWRDGKTETISGNDIADAFTKAGYGAGAIGALDYYKEVQDAQAAEHDPL